MVDKRLLQILEALTDARAIGPPRDYIVHGSFR